MLITQTVEIPKNRQVTIKVPREIQTERVIVTLAPEKTPLSDCPLCAKYRDPKSGALRPNAETIAAIEEGRAMMRGEIPANRFNSFDDMWEDLMKDDASEGDESEDN